MDIAKLGKRVFDLEIAELQSLRDRLGDGFREAVRLIRGAVKDDRKVIVIGVGKCSHIAEKIAATFTSTGTPAVVLNSMNALHGDLGIVRDGDVVLALSKSGETEEMVNLLSALRRFQVEVISMTGNSDSALGRNSDLVLDVRVDQEACPLSLAPTSSTTAMLVLGDALAMVLLELSGFREEDFARFHPGGTLGRQLLTTARDIMRPRDTTPFVMPGTLISDALDAMTRRKAGAALVMTPGTQELAGIFTHGDFVRAFREHGGKVAEFCVEELMTRDPISIQEDRLAAEVLGILKEHRIDELVVVDDDNHPVGMIDIQDLSRLRIL